MSREFSFYLGKSLTRFLKKPIRNQLDIIRLLLETVREIITPNSDTKEIDIKSDNDFDEGFRIVYPERSKQKIQRLFLINKYPDYTEKEMYTIQSFVFPFSLKTESDEIKAIYSSSSLSLEFDHAILSQVLSIINIIDEGELTWGDTWVEELMKLLYGDISISTDKIFYLVNELLTFDFGYLRFDNDPKSEGDNHPRYHIDTHMDNRATFKIGFHNKIEIQEFIDLLDNSSKVRYIEK